jgi:hypothetical protein
VKIGVNALANFTFLTQETNLKICATDPAVYLAEINARNPGVLESQWIPTDPDLWQYDRYRDFLAERRRILADSANSFLDSLNAGKVPETVDLPVTITPAASPMAPTDPSDEDTQLLDINEWVMGHGLPEGEFYFELIEEDAQEPTAIIDLAWPEGLQQGLSSPVALLLNEETEVEEAVNREGYRCFTSVESFKRYVERDILAVDLAAD